MKVSNPIALVESENTANAKSISNKNFSNLLSSIYLYIGAKVALTRNHLNVDLSNGSIRIVKEIFYDDNKPALALPKFVLVDFGESYMGASFFPSDDDKNGWFSIFPIRNSAITPNKREHNGFVEHTHTMLPLKLCWV